MSYHALNEAEAVKFAKNVPGLFDRGAELTCREIGDGNLNLVFHVKDVSTGKSAVLKQALPYAKVVGESWPLTLDRARIESEALLTEESLCPGLVPHVYQYVPELALTVMEDLSDHSIMRKGLIERNRYPLFSRHIAEFLARTLFFTSDLGMDRQEKKAKVKQFINPQLCKITEDLIFDHPYTDADTNNFNPALREDVHKIWTDKPLHLEVALLREGFLTRAQALLHGDLHTGSIFVTETSTKVIDPEFAYYGPMGFDIGAVIANLLLNFAGQQYWSQEAKERETYRTWLLQTVEEVWKNFEQNFRALWDEHALDRMAKMEGYQDLYMARLLRDTVGYAGCKMVRRVIGLAHAADIDKIPDANVKLQAERLALAIGTNLIKNHRRTASIGEALYAAKEAEGKTVSP